MSTQAKTGVGAALAILGALAIVLSLLLGWTEAPGPWDFLVKALSRTHHGRKIEDVAQ